MKIEEEIQLLIEKLEELTGEKVVFKKRQSVETWSLRQLLLFFDQDLSRNDVPKGVSFDKVLDDYLEVANEYGIEEIESGDDLYTKEEKEIKDKLIQIIKKYNLL